MIKPVTDMEVVTMLYEKLEIMNGGYESSYDEDYTFSELSSIFEQHGYILTSRCLRVDPWSNRGTYEYYTVPALPEREEVGEYVQDNNPLVSKALLCLHCDNLPAREGDKFCSDMCQKALEAEMPF